MTQVTIAPITSTIKGLSSEVPCVRLGVPRGQLPSQLRVARTRA